MIKIGRFKKNGLLLVGILTFQLAFSQENYIQGYVIKNNTDTLYGFVDYRNWGKNPDRVEFRTSIENDPIYFKPTDIVEFRVRDEIYVSAIVDTENSPVRIAELENDAHPNIIVDTVFIQTLFSGKKSLYHLKDRNGKENFYIKQGEVFELLIYKRYVRQHGGKQVISENNKYRGQLTLYLNDLATISSKLKNTRYEQKSLIKLFQQYHESSSSNVSFQKKEEKISVEFGVLAGVSFTSLAFRSNALVYRPLANAEYSSSVNFSTGLFFDLVFPRNQKKWSINNEVLLSSYKIEGNYELIDSQISSSVTTTEIGYSYVKINNLVRFKYPIGHLFLFVNGGISNGFVIDETNHLKMESKINTTTTIVEGLALNDVRKYELGYILGAGLKYNRLSLEIRYEKGNGMSEYVQLSSSVKRYYFLLGFRF